METKDVTSTIISTVRDGLSNQIGTIAKHPFDGASMQFVEKGFIETLGKSGASGLIKLSVVS